MVELTSGDLVIRSTPLPYAKAEDIMADVLQVVAAVIQSAMGVVDPAMLENFGTADAITLAPVLGVLAMQLGDGKLKRLAPLILAATSVSGPGEEYHLVDPKQRGACFDAHPELYFVCLFHAGKVTFGRFFPALGKRDRSKTPPTA